MAERPSVLGGFGTRPNIGGDERSGDMSRHLERIGDGEYLETVEDYTGCRWLYDDVCCNDSSEWLADFPLDFCKGCRYFTREVTKDDGELHKRHRAE